MILTFTYGAIDQFQQVAGWLWTLSTGSGGATPVIPDELTGGGLGAKARRRRRRRVSIDGRIYTVETPEDELRLLLAWRRRLQAQAEAPFQEPAEERAVKRTLRRVVKRVAKAEDRAEAWRRQVQRDDEEVLALYVALM